MSAFQMRPGDPTRDLGYWTYARRDQRGKTSALVSCPLCGTTGIIDNMTVDMNGAVGPGMTQCQKCDWRRYLLLLDWDPFYRMP